MLLREAAQHKASIERFLLEVERFKRIAIDLDVERVDRLGNAALRDLLAATTQTVISWRHPRAIEEFLGFAAFHREAEVRKCGLNVAAYFANREYSARRFIVWMLGDDEDHVVFEAIKLSGEHRLSEAIKELTAISGRASLGLINSTKPVGIGAAVVMDALIKIFGCSDADQVRALEDAYFDEGIVPEGTVLPLTAGYGDEPLPDIVGMVRIPAGDYISGIDDTDLPSPRFDNSDVFPRRAICLPGYLIDEYPVTNDEYDAWAESDEARQHAMCHPDEPDAKDHRRGTRRDERLGGDHPASGVDWFDAFSYCAHHGKELPSEFEWEKAARGVDGRVYPWGNHFDALALRWAGEVFGFDADDIPNVLEWRALLARHSDQFPTTLTAPVRSHPRGKSPYGVHDMIGNTWEWTRTNFFSRHDMDPQTSGRPRPEWAYSEESFVVLKGGAWSGIPEETTTFFRGKDLLTDRHNEIGFRGVIR